MPSLTRKLLWVLAVATLSLFAVPAYGQEEEQCPRCEVARTRSGSALVIINGSESTKVYFSLKNGEGDWVDFDLGPKHNHIFLHVTDIRIATDNGNEVQYHLEYQNRYKIYWDTDKQRWDLVKLIAGH